MLGMELAWEAAVIPWYECDFQFSGAIGRREVKAIPILMGINV